MPGNFVWAQGRAKDAATFARLEGCWYGGDRRIYIVSTSGGAVLQGQIWVYDPKEETIMLLFESPSMAVLNAPDNITVSPRGGLVLCEDGGGEEFLHGLTVDGEIFKFAKNNVVLNGERNGITGTSPARSLPVPVTALMATGCLPIYRARESPSRSQGPGRTALSNESATLSIPNSQDPSLKEETRPVTMTGRVPWRLRFSPSHCRSVRSEVAVYQKTTGNRWHNDCISVDA